MREDLKYPRVDAVKSVLQKIGIEPATRLHPFDQDYEYTTCELEELEQYFELYKQDETTVYEKRVLGCYFFECLNEFIGTYDKSHPLQKYIFETLQGDIEIHESEFEYWAVISESNEEFFWPITKEILDWRNTLGKGIKT